jgi:hypothetical protein
LPGSAVLDSAAPAPRPDAPRTGSAAPGQAHALAARDCARPASGASTRLKSKGRINAYNHPGRRASASAGGLSLQGRGSRRCPRAHARGKAKLLSTHKNQTEGREIVCLVYKRPRFLALERL